MATATGSDPINGLGYIGNDDYRGYLNYLSQSGDQNASALLGVVGNDGVLNTGGSPLNSATIASNAGYINNWKTPRSAAGSTSAGSGTTQQQIADSIAALTDDIGQNQSMLGSLDTQQQNGLNAITQDYNKNYSRYNQDQSLAQQNYDKQRGTTTQDKLDATDAIYQNGNTLADSVRRIIGLASGRNSTAYNEAAPGAIAKDMTIKTAANNATFKKNYDTIDNAQNDTNLAYQRNLQDLQDTTNQNKQTLVGGILDNKNKLLSSIANDQAQVAQLHGGSYLDGKAAAAATAAQRQGTQSAIDNLINRYTTPYAYQAVTPTAATTADYTKAQTPLSNPQQGLPAANDSPYNIALKKIFNGDQTTAPTPAAAGAPTV